MGRRLCRPNLVRDFQWEAHPPRRPSTPGDRPAGPAPCPLGRRPAADGGEGFDLVPASPGQEAGQQGPSRRPGTPCRVLWRRFCPLGPSVTTDRSPCPDRPADAAPRLPAEEGARDSSSRVCCFRGSRREGQHGKSGVFPAACFTFPSGFISPSSPGHVRLLLVLILERGGGRKRERNFDRRPPAGPDGDPAPHPQACGAPSPSGPPAGQDRLRLEVCGRAGAPLLRGRMSPEGSIQPAHPTEGRAREALPVALLMAVNLSSFLLVEVKFKMTRYFFGLPQVKIHLDDLPRTRASCAAGTRLGPRPRSPLWGLHPPD